MDSLLGDAQALSVSEKSHKKLQRQLDQRNYLCPGALWWIFDWQSAMQQYKRSGSQYNQPTPPDNWKPEQGSVLLIDEIDKADADLPNGLLETLGNGGFSVPWLNQPVTSQKDIPTPLVVITTNEERELPSAFVRRCLVLNLQLPTQKNEFIEHLVKRGQLHFKQRCHKDVYPEAAEQIWNDRKKAQAQGVTPPGQAEYIDILRVLANLETDAEKQMQLMKKIARFGFVSRKYPLENS